MVIFYAWNLLVCLSSFGMGGPLLELMSISPLEMESTLLN